MEPRRPEQDIEERPQGIGRSVPGNNRWDRMMHHTQVLADDLTEWVELRIELFRLEVEEEAESFLNKFIRQALLAVVAGVAVLFLLVTLALALGAWLGHPAWGFAIVTVLLGAAAGALVQLKPKFVERPIKLRSNTSSNHNRSSNE